MTNTLNIKVVVRYSILWANYRGWYIIIMFV